MVAAGALLAGAASAPDAVERPGAMAVTAAAPAPLKLLFSGLPNVTDTWGRLHFGVTPVSLIREGEPPPFTFAAGFARPDGS